MKIGIYLRVSTLEQTTDGQELDLKRFCELKGWSNIQIFKDEGISGTKESRPALDKLLKMAESKEIDAVLVWKFDRMSRSTKHLLGLLENFDKWGTTFVSMQENVDTSTAVGRMIFTVLGAVAQLERDVISDRTKAGLRNAVAQGKVLGRKGEVNKSKVIEYKDQGHTNREICKLLNISEGYCSKILKQVA